MIDDRRSTVHREVRSNFRARLPLSTFEGTVDPPSTSERTIHAICAEDRLMIDAVSTILSSSEKDPNSVCDLVRIDLYSERFLRPQTKRDDTLRLSTTVAGLDIEGRKRRSKHDGRRRDNDNERHHG